jgi:hypothetical protein
MLHELQMRTKLSYKLITVKTRSYDAHHFDLSNNYFLQYKTEPAYSIAN